MNDIEVRESIINQAGNIVVNASAGSGKTSIMIEKIENILKNNMTHYTIAATTFTNKASNEIKERLKKSGLGSILKNCFIGTNDSFAMDEIIRAFAKDAFEFDNKGQIESDYKLKFNKFEDGVEILTQKLKVGVYEEDKKNFKFELALYILKNSLASRRYLKSKYSNLFIDEYQDCDIDMHKLYLYISKELDINLFAVGDKKQSIYMWRGANPKYFNELTEDEDFSTFKLNINFRSDKKIQNYTNLFVDEDTEIYEDIENSDSVIFINTDYQQELFKLLDIKSNIAFIVRSNQEAEDVCNILNNMDESPKDFIYIPRTPLSKISSTSSWIGEIIIKIIFNTKYNEYDLKNDLPLDIDIQYLKNIVNNLRSSDDEENVIKIAEEFYKIAGYELESQEKDAIIETIKDDKYKIAYEDVKYNHVVMTIHSSKGLEFDEVVLFAKNYNLSRYEDKNNHYVAITRAKKRLLIFYDKKDWKSNSYTNSVEHIIKSKNILKSETSKYMSIYNK
ncbi:MAG: UvrD-helicase domain-containing protein [Paraclostridium sp.]